MNPKVLSFHYTLTNSAGKTLDSSQGQGPLTFLEGGQQIIPGLESELLKLRTGDKKRIEVKAAEAYGEYMEEMKISIDKNRLPNPDKVKVGDQFQAQDPSGNATVFTITQVSDTEVELDGNHPLAGQDLFFDVEITEIREATKDEVAHGHAHGPGGHHHH